MSLLAVRESYRLLTMRTDVNSGAGPSETVVALRVEAGGAQLERLSSVRQCGSRHTSSAYTCPPTMRSLEDAATPAAYLRSVVVVTSARARPGSRGSAHSQTLPRRGPARGLASPWAISLRMNIARCPPSPCDPGDECLLKGCRDPALRCPVSSGAGSDDAHRRYPAVAAFARSFRAACVGERPTKARSEPFGCSHKYLLTGIDPGTAARVDRSPT